MARNFVYNFDDDSQSPWVRATNTLNKWLWGAFCCGIPGVPCYFCACCEKQTGSTTNVGERPCVNQSTATADRMSRPHRPHAPGGRKSTPEMLSAVRCALNQLQGEPAPLKPGAAGVLVTQPSHMQTQPG